MQEYIEIADRYLEGNLSEEERVAFEERLLHDEDLREHLEEMKLLKVGIIHASRKVALQNLKALESTLPPIERNRFTLWTNHWLQAAAVLLIGLVTYALWPESVDHDEIFISHFEAYPNIIMPTVRGEVSSDSTLMAMAFRAYDQKQFEEAAILFNRIVDKDVNILFYLGNCYLATSHPEKALPLFEQVYNNYDKFDEQAEWYMAVSYLKLEDREKAKQVLQSIIDRKNSYLEKAQTIVTQLN